MKIKILIWSFWLYCCNCLVALLFIAIGSLLFHYHIHFYAVLIGGGVIFLAEVGYVLLALDNDHDDDDWYD